MGTFPSVTAKPLGISIPFRGLNCSWYVLTELYWRQGGSWPSTLSLADLLAVLSYISLALPCWEDVSSSWCQHYGKDVLWDTQMAAIRSGLAPSWGRSDCYAAASSHIHWGSQMIHDTLAAQQQAANTPQRHNSKACVASELAEISS